MSETQKPFARFESFNACVLEMMNEQHHNKEDAQAICGSIEHRAEKGMLYKATDNFEVIKKSNGDMYVYGPASWETPDMEYPVPDVATIPFQKNFLKKMFEMPEEYRNVSIDHQSMIIGRPVQKTVGDNGQTYYSHVHEKGMMLITKIRGDTNLAWVRKYRDDIEKGVYKMYSIRASNATREPSVMDGKRVNLLKDGDPIEVAIVRQGCCPKAGPLTVISKSGENLSLKFDIEKSTVEEIEKELLSKYQERSNLEKLLYSNSMLKESEAPVSSLTLINTKEPEPPDPIIEAAKEQIRQKLDILRVEIWALEEALKQKILSVNKNAEKSLTSKVTDTITDAFDDISDKFKSTVTFNPVIIQTPDPTVNVKTKQDFAQSIADLMNNNVANKLQKTMENTPLKLEPAKPENNVDAIQDFACSLSNKVYGNVAEQFHKAMQNKPLVLTETVKPIDKTACQITNSLTDSLTCATESFKQKIQNQHNSPVTISPVKKEQSLEDKLNLVFDDFSKGLHSHVESAVLKASSDNDLSGEQIFQKYFPSKKSE